MKILLKKKFFIIIKNFYYICLSINEKNIYFILKYFFNYSKLITNLEIKKKLLCYLPKQKNKYINFNFQLLNKK